MNFVKVTSFPDRRSAEFAASKLEAHGINVCVVADDGGGANASLLAGAGGAWITVSERDAAVAIDILAAESEPVNDEELDAEAMSYDPPENA